MKRFSAVALAVILFGSVLVMWSPYRWAASALQIGAFALACVWAMRFALGLSRPPSQPQFHLMLLPLGLTVLWPLAQLALHQTVYAWQTWNSEYYWAANVALFFSALQTFDDERLRKRFLEALLAFGFVISVIAPLQMFTADGKAFWLFQTGFHDYVLGPFVYHNQYAAFIEMLFPLALWSGFVDRRKAVYYLVIAGVMYSSVIASASRMGFILITLELLLVPLLLAAKKTVPAKRFAVAGGVFAGIAAILILAAGPANLWERFHAKAIQDNDLNTGRFEFVQSSLAMIQAKPLTGFGMGTWPTAYPGYALYDDGLFANQAHNDWAQWAVEGGLPFAAVMLWIALWSAKQGVRTVWGLGVPVVFLHCFVDYPIQRVASAGVLFVLLAAATADKSSAAT